MFYIYICFAIHITVGTKLKFRRRFIRGNKLYVLTYTFKKKEVDMNVTRTYSNEGKTLQELMEILLPIYIQEKTCNINEQELEYATTKILK